MCRRLLQWTTDKLNNGDKMIEFERYGRGAHKLLGIHGWFGDESTFRSLQLSLDPAEFECVWLAHRGYGKSMAIEGRYDMAEMASDALEVADSLGWKQFSAIGHSMGGKAVQLVAASAPDRVQKLVAVAPVGADPVPLDAQAKELFQNAADSAECRKIIVDYSTANRLSPVWVQAVVAASLARSTRKAFAAYFASWAGDDHAGTVKDMAADMLVLVGALDPVITAAVCEFGFRQRYAKLAIKELPSSGHYPMDEVPLLLGSEVLKHLKA